MTNTLFDDLVQIAQEPQSIFVALSNLPADDALPGDVSPELVRSIRAVGVLQPVALIETDNGYKVAAGRRRIKAARQAGLELIPARIWPQKTTLTSVIGLTENAARKKNIVSDFEAIQNLVSRGYTFQEIAAVTGLSIQAIKSRLRLTHLNPALFDALENGQIAQTVADAAARLPHLMQYELVKILTETGKVRMRDITAVKHVQKAKAADRLAKRAPELISDPATITEKLKTDDYLKIHQAFGVLLDFAHDPLTLQLLDAAYARLIPDGALPEIEN